MLTNGITLIILSLVAVPSLLLSRKPDAKELLDKIVPYQGWAGLVFCFWGIWGIVQMIFNLGWLGQGIMGIISWITWALYSFVETTLGFILGYSLIVKYLLSKNEQAKEKGAKLLAKLQPMQGKLGILGLIVGVWCIICAFIFTV